MHRHILLTGRGRYGIPETRPLGLNRLEFIQGLTWYTYKDSRRTHVLNSNLGGKGVQFYQDDDRFERVYDYPDECIPHLRKFAAVCAPDFSMYTDMPIAHQLWSHYRKQWVAKYWEVQGLTVIPTVGWSTPASYDFCFEGIPENSIVTVSSVGNYKGTSSYDYFLRGYMEMVNRLHPVAVLWRGNIPQELAPVCRNLQMNEQGDMHFKERHTAPKKGNRIKIKI